MLIHIYTILSMRIPNAAPAEVWLIATDDREYFITKTTVRFSGQIALNKDAMTKLNP